MFYDQIQKKMSRPGDKCVRIPTIKRSRSYWAWIKTEEGDFVEIEKARGWEIVKEV